MKKKKFSELVIIILILLFFIIPLFSLTINESVSHWPISSTRFVYNFLFK